jgi:hypothetical protein
LSIFDLTESDFAYDERASEPKGFSYEADGARVRARLRDVDDGHAIRA